MLRRRHPPRRKSSGPGRAARAPSGSQRSCSCASASMVDEPACEIHGAGRDLREGAVYAIFFAEAAGRRPLCYHLGKLSRADRPWTDLRRARRMRGQRRGLIAMPTEPTGNHPPPSYPRASSETVMTTREAFLRVFPGVMVAMFLAAADQTILASALPTIASSLGGLADVLW